MERETYASSRAGIDSMLISSQKRMEDEIENHRGDYESWSPIVRLMISIDDFPQNFADCSAPLFMIEFTALLASSIYIAFDIALDIAVALPSLSSSISSIFMPLQPPFVS